MAPGVFTRALLGVALAAVCLAGACTTGSPAASPQSGRATPSGGSSVPAAVVAPSTPAPLPPLRITYSAAIALYVPLYMAKEEGFFRKYGVDAEISYADATVGRAGLVSGEIDANFSNGQNAIAIAAAGADLVVLDCLDSVSSDYVIMAQPGIRQIADLRGKLIGVSRPTDLSVGYLSVVLQREGLSTNDVSLRSLGGQPERQAGLESHQVDAVILSAPYDHILERAGFSRVLNLVDLRLPTAGRCLYTLRRTLDAKRGAFEAAVKAIVEAEHFVKTNPERAMAVMAQYTSETDPEVLRVLYDSIAPWSNKVPTVSLDGLRFQADFTATITDSPQLRDYDVTQMVDESIVRELERNGFIDRVYGP
jgi:ABC-type nitrate/sulfonate/bicarbonate transport system substrate-binding protein